MTSPNWASVVLGLRRRDKMADQKRAVFHDIEQIGEGNLRSGSSTLCVEAHRKLIDIIAVRPIVQMPLGFIGTIVDSDGNYEQCIEQGSPLVH